MSDVHLGCRYSQAEKFLSFLESVQPERLYIVGDFIDGWRLKRRWFWQAAYVRILQRLLHLASQGTQLYYAPGNHDEFLRDFLHDFGTVTVANQFIHRTADGRRFVVLHGDQFDDVERRAKWLSVIGAMAYDGLVRTNGIINIVRRWMRLKDCRFSSHVKVWAKQAVQFISDFEDRLTCHAKESGCHGVICGHIHVPRLDQLDTITYCNTGDWVEHCSALVEDSTGELKLVEWNGGSAHPLSSELATAHCWQSDESQSGEIETEPCQPVAPQLAATMMSHGPHANHSLVPTRPANVAGLLH